LGTVLQPVRGQRKSGIVRAMHSTPKRLLITGSSGFVGQWCLRAPIDPKHWTLVPTSPAMDLTDLASIQAELADAKPDAVLHLAGQSFVPASFEDPQATLETNLIGTLHLLQALKATGFRGRLVYVSSADVYGQQSADQMPIPETRLALPRNPYAVSKLAAEALCRQWHFSEGLDAVIARPFNHIGPGQDPRFVVSGMARQFATMASGQQQPRLVVGNLDVSRDFTDVRDVVQAYFNLLQAGEAGETYNICSGRATALRDVVATLSRISGVYPDIEVDPARLRANEQTIAFGYATRIQQATGWRTNFALEQSLTDTYRYWEGNAKHEQN